jgi:hypothetical protein
VTARSNLVDFVVGSSNTEYMSADSKTPADEFSYPVPAWLWERRRTTVLRNARIAARRKRMRAEGEPQVHVVLVWPQEQAESVA